MDTMATDPGERLQLSAQAQLAATALASGRHIDAWSRMLAFASLLYLLWPGPPSAPRLLLALSLAAALLQAWWAWRVALDARIFAAWAAAWQRPGEEPPGDAMQRFDRALGDWLPGAAARRTTRTLADRARGARALLTRQLLALGVQGICTVTAIVAGGPR